MDETRILIADKTRADIERFISNPSHALLLVGLKGMGKTTLAEYIAERLLGLDDSQKLHDYPYFYFIQPDKNTIGIDSIRELKSSFNLRTTGSKTIRRVILIEDAQTMTVESQNAILKIVEEPPVDSVIIMTLTSRHLVRPTILSRCQSINIGRPNIDMAYDFFTKEGFKTENIKKNYLLSNGMPALTASLLDESNEDPLVKMVQEAKEILKMSRLDKLSKINELVADKQSIDIRLFALKQVVNAALKQAIEKDQKKLIDRWYKIAKQIQSAQKLATNSVNLKALYTNLFLSM